MGLVAALLLGLLFLRAILTADPYFDSFAYHLPFAARLAGLCPETCYRMGDYLEAAYDGFPKLFHTLSRLGLEAHRPAASCRCSQYRRSRTFLPIPAPVVSSSCRLDRLRAACRAAHPNSRDFDLHRLTGQPGGCGSDPRLDGAHPHTRSVWLAEAPRARRLPCVCSQQQAANACVAGLRRPPVRDDRCGLARVRASPRPVRSGPTCQLDRARLLCSRARRRRGRDPRENALTHGNPLHPFRVALPGLILHGPIDALSTPEDSLADDVAALSVATPMVDLGAGVRRIRLSGGSLDRRSGSLRDRSRLERLLEVTERLLSHGRLLCAVRSRPGGISGLAAWFQTGPGPAHFPGNLRRHHALAACLPRSHELRYYLFWVIVLVALCLIAAFDVPEGESRASAKVSGLLATVVVIALTSVLLMTQARYVTPIGRDLDVLIATFGVKERVAAIPEGAIVCVDPGWQPFTFLFAPIFHPGRSYTVLDGYIGPCRAIVPPPSEPRESS